MIKRTNLILVLGILTLVVSQGCQNDNDSTDKPNTSSIIDCLPYYFPCVEDTVIYTYNQFTGNSIDIETVAISCSEYLILEAKNNSGVSSWNMTEEFSSEGPKLKSMGLFKDGDWIKGDIISPYNFPVKSNKTTTTEYFMNIGEDPVYTESHLTFEGVTTLEFNGEKVDAIILRRLGKQTNQKTNQFYRTERLLYYGKHIGLMRSEEIVNGGIKLISELESITVVNHLIQ